MARGKSTKLKPFQKLLTVMISGKQVTVDEIDTLLGKEIYMYRLSTYMWHIKTNANGVIKPIKEGRKCVAYQLVNVKEVKEYMDRVGITKSGFVPGAAEKAPSTAKAVKKLTDLGAKKVTKTKVEPVTEAESESDLEITEITE